VDPFDVEIHDRVLDWETKGEREMGKTIGCSNTDLDAVDAHSRSMETPLGNFFTDSVRAHHKTDVALINGGTIRGNKVFPKGDLSKKTLVTTHPFGNAIVKIWATGQQIKAFLEQELRCYESFCGNFVQVSGLKYPFDSSAPVGQRLKDVTHSDGTPLKDEEELTVALSDFMMVNSALRNNKLYNMVTMNDAVPIVMSLFRATQEAHAKGACIDPEVEGRITNLSKE